MTERKPWTPEEDNCLESIILAGSITSRNDWKIISEDMENRLSTTRTPKQCRDRWHNHLRPGVIREPSWSQTQHAIVFKMQAELGNRWSLIANKLPGRTDNAVKNFFYSTLRKALRRVNGFITQHRSHPICKGLKVFSESTVCKVIAMADGKTSRMRILGLDLQELSKQLRTLLLSIEGETPEDELMLKVITQLLTFNRQCRKVRGKRRISKDELSLSEDSDLDDNLEADPVIKIEAKSWNATSTPHRACTRNNEHQKATLKQSDGSITAQILQPFVKMYEQPWDVLPQQMHPKQQISMLDPGILDLMNLDWRGQTVRMITDNDHIYYNDSLDLICDDQRHCDYLDFASLPIHNI